MRFGVLERQLFELAEADRRRPATCTPVSSM
jgi:hypothetical protein